MKQIYDYNFSQPFTSQGGFRVIPAAPDEITVAEFGLYVPDSSKQVELIAAVGIQATQGSPNLFFLMYRGNSQIFATTHESASVDGTEFTTFNWAVIDNNPPAGYHLYKLAVLIDISAGPAGAQVIGPVMLRGMTVG